MPPEALDQALAAFHAGKYERAVVPGAPLDPWPNTGGYTSSADRVADYLRAQGLPESQVVVLRGPASAQDRTFLSAVLVRDWAKRAEPDLRAIDLFSEGTHARRSRMLYQIAFGPDTKVGVLASRPSGATEDWWHSAYGTRYVLDQAIALAWTKLFFWPPPKGSHEERWARPAPR